VWDKGQRAFSMSDCELAWSNRAGALRIFDMARKQAANEAEHHPTQKPVRLMAWCLAKVPSAATVLDAFMGSGSTGVACAQLGKSFTGIERERKYFDIACERISRAQAQGQLIPPEPAAEMVQEGLL
jgi:site-specific DNA-methyltransferase (adenine-specific)